MFRGYDSEKVLREDILLRIQHLYDEIAALHRSMDNLKKGAAASERRIQRLKKELGISHSP